jgi:uncharacterized protein YhbP (UPF0306 family)
MNDEIMNEHIFRFLKQQTCATICCTDTEGNPYCFNCFYAFNQEDKLLYFKSSPDAYHSKLLVKKSVIAGTVLPDKLDKLMTKGIQLQGKVLDHLHPLALGASVDYHKKHPIALAMKGEVFTIFLDSIKMKDSHLGFGNSMVWKRGEYEFASECAVHAP